MNKFEKLAAAMRDQVEHPDQNPEDALRKAGLEPTTEKNKEVKAKKISPLPKKESKSNWMQGWEQERQ